LVWRSDTGNARSQSETAAAANRNPTHAEEYGQAFNRVPDIARHSMLRKANERATSINGTSTKLREFAGIADHALSKKFPLGVVEKEKLQIFWNEQVRHFCCLRATSNLGLQVSW
jgi:hypothetical protein